MRILLIHQYFLEKDDGGGSRFNEMTRVWEEKGHEITVLAGMVHYATGKKQLRYVNKFISREQYSKDTTVLRCHVSEAYNTNLIGRLWAYVTFIFSSLYAGLFKTEGKFDIIVVTSPPLFVGISAYLLSRLKRIPFIFEVRDLWPDSMVISKSIVNDILFKILLGMESFFYRKAIAINVLTPSFRKVLIEEKNVPPEKIIYIPNGSDFTLAEQVNVGFDRMAYRKKYNFADETVIVYLGAHGLANHLVQVLDTAEILKNENLLFVMVGDGIQKAKLIEDAQKRKLDNIKFIDSVPKAEALKIILAADIGTSVLKKSDLFKTIYSNKTFDYMSCKKPILMVIDGISRDLVEEAKCGIFAEPENPEDIAEKIMFYLNNKSLMTTHGEAGYIFAKEHFDRDVLGLKYIDETQRIVNESQRR